MGESSQELSNDILPPPNLYNKAILEAYINAAAKSESIGKYSDLVFIVGGSFAKGLGHYYSDSDLFFLCDENNDEIKANELNMVYDLPLSTELTELIDNNIDYHKLKRYTQLGEIIKGRTYRSPVRSPLFNRRSQNRPALLERAAHILPPPSEFPNQISYVSINNLELEPITESESQISKKLREFDATRKYTSDFFDDVILILASEAGVNSYEVTPGQLDKYKRSIVETLRTIHDSDASKYTGLLETIRRNYLHFARKGDYDPDDQASPKSTQFVSELLKNSSGETILPFYRYSEFPDLEELEKLFIHNADSNSSK